MKFKNWFTLTESEGDINTIIKSLPGFYSGGIPEKLMTNIIYSYLTTHGDRESIVVKTLRNDPQKYKQYNDTYKQLIQMLSQALSQKGWKPVDGGAWIEWYRNGNTKSTKVDNSTPKRYVSIAPDDMWTVLQSLTVLANNLMSVKTDPNHDLLGFKIPTNFGSFFQHKDNICIHFYDPNAQGQIEQAVQSFFQQIGKKEMDRSAMGKVNFGKDAQGTSDSMLVASQVVRNLRHNQAAFQQMLSQPAQAQNLPKVLDNMIRQISTQASHRQPAVA